MYPSAKPSPPNMTIVTNKYHAENFLIFLSWDSDDADSYRVSINPSTQSSFYTNMTTAILEGQYNTQLQVSLKAINCAGIQEVSHQVFVGEYISVSSCSNDGISE